MAALIADPGDPRRFLVQQRLANKSRPLLWEFPGGKVEPGESDEAALVRECKEELDVELSVGALLWECVHEYPDLVVQLRLLSARILRGTPKALGAEQLRYCTPEEMATLPFCEADIPLVADLATGRIRHDAA